MWSYSLRHDPDSVADEQKGFAVSDPYLKGFCDAMATIETVVAGLRPQFDPEHACETPDLVRAIVEDWQRLNVDSMRLSRVEAALRDTVA